MGQPELPFDQHIRRAAKEIEETLRGSDFGPTVLKQIRFATRSQGELDSDGIAQYPFFTALAMIEAFSDVVGVSFFAIG